MAHSIGISGLRVAEKLYLLIPCLRTNIPRYADTGVYEKKRPPRYPAIDRDVGFMTQHTGRDAYPYLSLYTVAVVLFRRHRYIRICRIGCKIEVGTHIAIFGISYDAHFVANIGKTTGCCYLYVQQALRLFLK